MKVFGERIRSLRESMNYSQVKFAETFGIGQSSVVRYEKGEASPSLELLVKIADYCDVSLDYVLGRTDNPQGKLYDCKPPNGYSTNMENFVEMCFAPGSPMNARLKQAILQMLEERDNE
ncbi:MAG: helix-turn-helix transcriptional regulator [Oscillospiraceae bacterium]|nr:helix-turn-helix transcriptional regulator [Oscillospiraceae bacterium]